MLVINVHNGYPMIDTRPHVLHPENLTPLVTDYVNSGADFAYLQTKVDFYMVFYYQLQKHFGWEAYRSVFRRDKDLPNQPTSADEKRDMWLIIFSNVTGRNLANLYRSWGIPFSPAAEEAVSHLPDSGFLITSLLE